MPDYHGPLIPNEAYHIFNHANGFENLFMREENYSFFLQKYALYASPVVQTYAYCLLPNHFHFLVRVRSESELERHFLELKASGSKSLQGFQTLEGMGIKEISNLISRQFSHLFNSYTQAFNKQQNRRGSLFIPNFKRSLISNDAYFYTVLRYIHQNPVKHGFRKGLLDWPHSSIHAYLGSRDTKLERKAVLNWFGGTASARTKEFWAFHQLGWDLKEVDLEV